MQVRKQKKHVSKIRVSRGEFDALLAFTKAGHVFKLQVSRIGDGSRRKQWCLGGEPKDVSEKSGEYDVKTECFSVWMFFSNRVSVQETERRNVNVSASWNMQRMHDISQIPFLIQILATFGWVEGGGNPVGRLRIWPIRTTRVGDFCLPNYGLTLRRFTGVGP